MGNHQFRVPALPQRGQICTICDSSFTQDHSFPKNVFGQGVKVKVLGSKNLLCSRPNAQQIPYSIVQFPDGRTDVYLSNNLKPV